MSIFFDFNTGSNGRRFRRAVNGDASDIELIIDRKYSEPIFGDVDIASIIELSTLSICMINEKNEVIGFVAACDHPNVPGVEPAHWELWVRNMFQKYYLSRNTLFIHLMCCTDAVKECFVQEAFHSIFRNDVYLLHIILVMPTNCPPDYVDFFLSYFKKLNIYKHEPKQKEYECKGVYLYTALQKDFCPKFKMRRAVEEDNDEIVQILGKNCNRLQEMYGDFYISELIGRHPEMNRRIIVAESQDQVMGVMCLNSDVNYEMLQETYELVPYHGLCKPTPVEKELLKRNNEVLRVFGEPIMRGNWSPVQDNLKRLGNIGTEKKTKLSEKPGKVLSKVIFHNDDPEMETLVSTHYHVSKDTHPLSPATSVDSPYYLDLDLGEDSFDYDIINIDDNLLTVPLVKSEEFLLSPQVKRRMSKVVEAKASFESDFSQCQIAGVKEETQTIRGGPNAFTIELFGLREDVDETHAFELLEAAFETMKGFDYCVIQVPCEEKSFYLLEHFSFVPTQKYMYSKYALYVAHRNSVLSKLRVRKAEIMDIPQIANFLQTLESKETLVTVKDTVAMWNQHQAFVFMSSMTLVGIAVLEPPEQVDFLRTNLNMEEHRIHKYHIKQNPEGGLAMLKWVLAYPVFEPHYRFFARDLMRLSGNTTLMWLTAYRNKWVILKANSLVSSMISLIPRQAELGGSTPDLQDAKYMSDIMTSFSSWLITKRFTSVPKVNINTRIVVVGASRTAMAFLNTLLFSDSSSYLLFNNLTLVSPNGLPYGKQSRPLADMMFNYYKTNTDRYLKNVPYTFYVNVIKGMMVDINQREKYIQLSNGSNCYYDILILLFGKQYQHPNYIVDIVNREKLCDNDGVYRSLGTPHGRTPLILNQTPRNVFIVNTIDDANKALSFVSALDWHDDKNTIIVYGSTLNAYCCLATLTEMNVPGRNIIFVDPFPEENPRKSRVSLFCNTYVDSTVHEVIKNLQITVYKTYYFQSWNLNSKTNFITHVEFLSYSKFIRLNCTAFFYYGKRGVNEQAFIAICRSGIVYDGGILIDDQFRANESSIYAAGPVTRYHRSHFAESQRQKYYDAYEVGHKLGTQILNDLDPLFPEKRKCDRSAKRSARTVSFSMDATSENVDETGDSRGNTGKVQQDASKKSECGFKPPSFKLPLVTHCTLPGPMQYLDVRPPGKQIPHQYVMSLQYNGLVLETFKSGYFKLHFNKDLRVDGITCLTAEKYSLENFKHIYGLSSLVLNNVYVRYTAKKLDNFYEFFQMPWANFLYHDQRTELFSLVKEILPKNQRGGKTLSEALHDVTTKLTSPSLATIIGIHSRFEKSKYYEAITEYVIEWISQNDALLSMYLSPYDNNYLSHDPNVRAVYKKRKIKIARMLYKII